MVRIAGPVLVFSTVGLSAAATGAAVFDAVQAHGGAEFVAVAAATATLGAVAGAWLLKRSSGWHHSPLDGRTSDLSEIMRVDERGVYQLKGGGFGAVLELSGVDYGSRSDRDEDNLVEIRAKALRELAREKNFIIKILAKRTKREPIIIAETGDSVLDEINRRWESRFYDASFRNQYYIFVETQSKSDKILNDVVLSLKEGLADYNPAILDYDKVVSLVGLLINGRPIVVNRQSTIEDMIGVVRVGFDPKAGRVLQREDGFESETAALGFVGWGQNDVPQVIDGILTLPMAAEVLIVLAPTDRELIGPALELDRRQAGKWMASSEVNQQFEEAKERVAADADVFFHTTCTVFITGGADEVDTAAAQVRQFARNFGHDLRSETQAIEAVWRSRLPGTAVFVRKRRLQGINIAKVMRFDAAPEGASRCDWGPGFIRPFATLSGSPYRLQLHVDASDRAVAHSLIIGPTGSGKSALALHLMSGALGFDHLKVIGFDSGQGLRPFCEAVGTYIQVGQDCKMNPLQTMETEADEAFVNRFLRMLAGVDDAAAYELAQQAIVAIRGIPRERRSLRGCLRSAFAASDFSGGLRRWADTSGVGNLFNQEDNLQFAAKITGIAMDELYDTPEAIAATIDYIVHRIKRLQKHGAPMLIFIDEAPRLLSNATFQTIAKQWLLEMRKARGAVMLAFQSPSHIFDLNISSTLLESCPTRFLLPNVDAKWEDYQALGVTPSQFDRLRRKVPGEYWVLLQRSGETVALDINLRALGPMLKLYRGGPNETKLMNELQREYGSDWVWHYVNS